jgi:hypothetical protein
MELESPPVPSTPGCSEAMAAGSEASIGRRASWSGLKPRSEAPAPAPSLRAVVRAVTVTGASATDSSPMWMLATMRSSSAWRAMVIWEAAMPTKRAVSS